MRLPRAAAWIAAGVLGVACNAVLGLDELEEKPPGGGSAAEAGDVGSGGTTSTGGSSGEKGGTAGTGTSKGGRGGASGSGTAGDAGAGMGGGDGECTPDETAPCTTADPTLLGNCADGTVTCRANGTWGACSVMADDADSCDAVGDDADCDGTPNGGCPCLNGEQRECGPDSEDGICQKGTQTCASETWGTCEGAVFPKARDCMSPNDNDCDGVPDDARDDVCPCAVDGAHVCVENAPSGWEGPFALASAAATASSPSCTGTGYERQVLTKFGVVDQGTATCGCDCGAPASQSCGAINMQRGTVSCIQLETAGGAAEYPNMTAGSCVNVLEGQNYYPGSAWSGGSCTPQPSSNFVRAKFTRRMTGCETNSSSPAGCSTMSECVPELDSPLEKFCIYRDGDLACPSGPFSEKTLFSDTVDDPRSCSTCTCGGSTGSCSGHVDFVRQPCPGTILSARVNYGVCANVSDGGLAIAAKPSQPMPSGSCPPSSVSVQGSVSTTGDTTVCCKP